MDDLRQRIDTCLDVIDPNIRAAGIAYPPYDFSDEITRAARLLIIRASNEMDVDQDVLDVVERDLLARASGRSPVIINARFYPAESTIWFWPGQEPTPLGPHDREHRKDYDIPSHVSRRYPRRGFGEIPFLYDILDVTRFDTSYLDALGEAIRARPGVRRHG